jgi:hypothetical protein
VAKLSDSDWEVLSRDLSARVAVFAPEWTEFSDSDPGITLVELFAFLTESLAFRADQVPRARSRLRDVLAQLERIDPARCADATLTRNRYFDGQRLSAADFEQEQDYIRAKQRRHNRLLHGTGIVYGLDVGLDSDGDAPVVAVSPGLAIGPNGEELLVCERVTTGPCPDRDPCHVFVRLAGRPTGRTVDGEATRIEESAEVSVLEDVPSDALAIARLRRDGNAWRLDPSFEAPRVGG